MELTVKVFSARKLNDLLSNPCVNASGVAKVAGISATGLYNVRKGIKQPKADTLAAIASALNKPIEYFFEEESLIEQTQQKLALDKKAVGHG